MKQAGKPSAGKPPAGFDAAGAGTRPTVRLVKHSQRKRGTTDRLNLRGHRRQSSTLPMRGVLIAFIVGILGEIHRHWPYFGYAIAGFAVNWFFWNTRALKHMPGWFHWNELPWPWSQLAFELTRPALVALASLPILAAGLAIERSFRWVSLLRTTVINLTLITLGHYSIDLFP